MNKPPNEDLLARLKQLAEDDDGFISDHQRGARRIKLEKGHALTVRFLPADLYEGCWWARIAKHWFNRNPLVCPTDTAPQFGGDPQFHCPVCAVVRQYESSDNPELRNLAYGCRATPQWLVYCLVFERDGAPVKESELTIAYEFPLYTSTWNTLKTAWFNGLRKGAHSILDYKNGNDFVVSRDAKGYHLDKQDSSPIFDLEDPNFDAHIAKIEASIMPPNPKIPSVEELGILADKIAAEAERLDPDGGRVRRVRQPTKAPTAAGKYLQTQPRAVPGGAPEPQQSSGTGTKMATAPTLHRSTTDKHVVTQEAPEPVGEQPEAGDDDEVGPGEDISGGSQDKDQDEMLPEAAEDPTPPEIKPLRGAAPERVERENPPDAVHQPGLHARAKLADKLRQLKSGNA